MKQKDFKNKFILKTGTYKIVFELGMFAASYLASFALRRNLKQR
jgi:hypothetical protein